MALEQEKRHALGREAEKLVAEIVNGEQTSHTAPFDVVDFNQGVAYEVKAMSGMSKDLKVHISDKSMARKVEFATQYNLKMILVVVVIHSIDHYETYWGELKNSIRITQLTKTV